MCCLIWFSFMDVLKDSVKEFAYILKSSICSYTIAICVVCIYSAYKFL